jgi:hypothetical protein
MWPGGIKSCHGASFCGRGSCREEVIPHSSFIRSATRRAGPRSLSVVIVEFAASGGAADFAGDNTGIDELLEERVVGGTLFQAFGVSVVGPFTITAAGR